MKQTTLEHILVSWILPALLWAATWLVAGFHYETNDDLLMSFIARGILFGQPVADYSIYFHGFGKAFVWLYGQFPAVPWYGLILYLLLFIATQLAFRFVYVMLKPHFSFRVITVVLLLFYVANWYEHAFWFNYMRVPFLLTGVALLSALTSVRQSFKSTFLEISGYAFLFFLALCIRPGAALLGVGVVLPALAFYLFGSGLNFRLHLKPLLPFIIAGGAFLAFLQLTSGNQADQYRKIDTLKSGVVDYRWCCGAQENPHNKLIVTGLENWFLADKKVWTNFLAQENNYPDWHFILKETVPAKLIQAFKYLVFDQFLMLGLLFGLWLMLYKNRPAVSFRKVSWLQLYFWLLIFGIGLILKLPPRVLTPALSLLFLAHLTLLPDKTEWLVKKTPPFLRLTVLLLIGLQVYKIATRLQWQQNKQAAAENFFSSVQTRFQNKIFVTADFGADLRALSPFRNYHFGPNKVLMLTGWHTLDPHFTAYCQQLSGSEDIIQTIQTLSSQPNTVWIMRPEFKTFLEQYLAQLYHDNASLKALQESETTHDPAFRIYSVPE